MRSRSCGRSRRGNAPWWVRRRHAVGRAHPARPVHLVLSEETIERPATGRRLPRGDVNEAHPLAALLAHTPDQAGVRHLRRTPCRCLRRSRWSWRCCTSTGPRRRIGGGDRAAHAGQSVRTLELLNALRRDGVPDRGGRGWRWSLRPSAPSRRSEPARLLMARVEARRRVPRRWSTRWPAWVADRRGVAARPQSVSHRIWTTGCSRPPGRGAAGGGAWAHQAVRFRHDRLRDALRARPGPQRRHGCSCDGAAA